MITFACRVRGSARRRASRASAVRARRLVTLVASAVRARRLAARCAGAAGAHRLVALVVALFAVRVVGGLERRSVIAVGGGGAGGQRAHKPRRLVLLRRLPLGVCGLVDECRKDIEVVVHQHGWVLDHERQRLLERVVHGRHVQRPPRERLGAAEEDERLDELVLDDRARANLRDDLDAAEHDEDRVLEDIVVAVQP